MLNNLPWRADRFEILDATGRLVASASILGLPTATGDVPPGHEIREALAQAEQRAQFIVDAVNTQTPLRKSLRAETDGHKALLPIVKWLDTTGGVYRYRVGGGAADCFFCRSTRTQAHPEGCPAIALNEARMSDGLEDWGVYA